MIKAHAGGGALQQLFYGREYKDAALSAEKRVEEAMRALMSLAVAKSMAGVTGINAKVDTLLRRRLPPRPDTQTPN